VVALVLGSVVIPAGPAHAAVGVGVSFDVPSSVVVGQRGVAGSFTFTNTNTGVMTSRTAAARTPCPRSC